MDGAQNFYQLLTRPMQLLFACSTHDLLRHLALGRQKRVDPLLERPLHKKFVDVDGLVLTDSVHAVSSLRFSCRIPPAVGMDDVVGRREIDPVSGCLQAAQGNRHVIAIEAVHERLPIVRAPVNTDIANIFCLAGQLKEIEHTKKVTEDDDLFSLHADGA